MKNQRVARLSKHGVLFLAEDNSVIVHSECGQSMWDCGYCREADADFESEKWITEVQNPNTSEERKQEMLLEHDKEMVLEDLKGCPLTREQVTALFKLRDSFTGDKD